MSTLPRVSGREVVKALRTAGYERDRQRGSHISFGNLLILIDVSPSRITKRKPKERYEQLFVKQV